VSSLDLNNPAARLESILRTISGQDRGPTPFSTFCRMWDLNEGDRRHQMVALQRIGDVVQLSVEVRERAERVPKFGAMVLRNYDQVEETVFNLSTLSRSHPLDHCLTPMAPTAWTSLEQLHDLLENESHRLELEDHQTDDLLQQVMDLIVTVKSAGDLDDIQRSTMLGHLIRVQQALLDINVVGPERVEQAVDGLMGGLVRLSIRTRAFAQHPVVTASLKLIATVALVLGVAADWTSLTAAGIGTLMLERGSGDAGGAGGGGSG